MLNHSFTVKFITSRHCFLALSEANIRKLSYNKIIKLNCGTKELYFSCVQNPQVRDNNIIGIPTLYAKILGICENESVFINDILHLPILGQISLSPLSFEDYEILESASDTVQSTLLGQIRVINKDQKLIIWISKWLHTAVKIEDADSMCFGVIANLTEVHIIPPHKSNTSIKNDLNKDVKNNLVQEELVPVEIKCSPEILQLQNYLNIKKPVMFRVHPLVVPQNLTKHDLIACQPFNIFIHKINLPNFIKINNYKDVVLSNISRIDPPVDFRDLKEEFKEFKTDIVVRVCLIEEYFDLFSSHMKACFSEIILNKKYPIIFVSEKIMTNFDLIVGSKISLGNSFPFQSNITSVEVVVTNKKIKNITQQFKSYMAEQVKHGKCVLNSNICIEIQTDVICSLNFHPPSEYCLFDEDVLRNCKIYENTDINIVYEKKKITPLIESSDILNKCKGFITILKQGQRLLSLQNSTENLFIVGKSGSGKTTLAKIICQNLSEKPTYMHVVYESCKKLKGKSIESLHKIFSQDFQNMIYYQPCILVLDDIHIICGRSEAVSEVQTQESLYFNRVSEVLSELIEMFQKNNKISVVATCESTMKINENLLSPRGKHLFKNIFTVPELSKTERETILEYLFLQKSQVENDVDFNDLSIKTEGFVVQNLVDFASKSVFETVKRNVKSNELETTVSLVDIEKAYTSTMVLALRDVRFHSPGDKDFSDVGGLQEVKKSLLESMRWPAQYPELFSDVPLRLQSGVLLFGPPGVGKTLLIGATARQCNLRLIIVKGPELLSKYVGASEQAVRGIFEKAQSARPCILFFDEFDSLAARRGHDSTGVTDRVVNQLLTQLDGVECLTGVFVIAATSRPDLLDPALLRPGRLDRQLMCSVPDQAGRLAILKALSKNLLLAKDVDLKKMATAIKGFSGADIQAVLYTAQLFSVEENIAGKEMKSGNVIVTKMHLQEALENTRPALSKQDIQKYEQIYSKFQRKPDEYDSSIKKQRATLA